MSRPCFSLVLVVSASLVGTVHAGPILPGSPAPTIWFNAGTITPVATGTPVTTWNDSSVNANNLTAIDAAKPTYVAGTPGTLGGQPYVQFGTGGDTAMATISPVPASLTGDMNATVFIVMETTTTASLGTFGWGQTGAPAGAFGLVTQYEGSNVLSVETAGGNPAIFGNSALTVNAFQIMEVQKSSGGSIATTTTLAVDGAAVPIQSGSPNPLSVAAGQFYLGQWADYPPFPMIGNVAEVIVYDSLLNPSQSAAVQAYLDAKYFPVVPEPGSLLLMLFGAILLAAAGHRRLQQSVLFCQGSKVPRQVALKIRSCILGPMPVACAIMASVVNSAVADSIAIVTPATAAVFTGGAGGGLGGPPQSTIGYEFQTGAAPLLVSALGAWDLNTDTPSLSESHQVAIWNSDGSSELALATVLAGSPPSIQIGAYGYVNLLTPVLLSANTDYVIGLGTGTVDSFHYSTLQPSADAPVFDSPVVTYVERLANFAGGFGFPTGNAEPGTSAWDAPNFIFTVATPEPATHVLLAFGVIFLISLRLSHKALFRAKRAC